MTINASEFIRENKLYVVPSDRNFSNDELVSILDKLENAAMVGIELPTGDVVYGVEARHHLNYEEFKNEYEDRTNLNII